MKKLSVMIAGLLISMMGLAFPSQAQTIPFTFAGTSPVAFQMDSYGNLSSLGTFGTGTFSLTGAGTRMFWYPGKAAFRAGYVSGTQWNDVSIGNYSVAFGANNTASGSYSFALGSYNQATGVDSVAIGSSASATGNFSFAQGDYSYNATTEPDLTPKAPNDPGSIYTYADLSGITDPLGNSYSFSYVMDHSKLNYMSSQIHTGYYTQSGSPRNIAAITMPDNSAGHPDISTFVNKSLVFIPLAQDGTLSGQRQNQVTDSTGFTRTYSFGSAVVVPVPSFPQKTNNVTSANIVVYRSLNINYGNFGSETFQFNLNASMALSQVTDLAGNTTQYTQGDPWPSSATYLQRFAPGTNINEYYNDPTSQTDALGNSKTFTYYGGSRIMQSVVDENGNKTWYDIDSLGRRTTEKIYAPAASGGAEVQETDFAYGSSAYPGFMTQKVVKALGGSDPGWTSSLTTNYVPDANGRVAQEIVDPGGLNLVTSYTYDADGNKLASTDPKGQTTWFSYDARNRLVFVTYADGSQKQIDYDARGNKIAEHDENGILTLYQYDALNRLVVQARDMNGNGVIDPGTDLVTAYTYNNANSKLTTTNPMGGVTSMAYDNLQRVTQITDALSHVTTFAYGANSGGNAFDSSSFKPTHIVDPRGFTTDVTYDALYRPVTKAVQYDASAVPATTSTQYDAVGNPILVTDPLGHQTKVCYDALNRPTITIAADNSKTKQFYTSTGFKYEVTDQNGNSTQTQYDNAGRATVVTQPPFNDGAKTQPSPVTTTVYDAAGNVAETINPLGNKWDYVYDARNRKLQEIEPSVTDAVTGTASRPTLAWQYDPAGRTVAAIDARGYETDTIYDPANRVTQVNAPAVPVNGGSTARPNTTTTYDLDGNVHTAQDPNGHVTTNTYDLLNRLLITTDAENITVQNTYDAVGNKLTVSDGKNQITTFAYDGLNRNTLVTDAAGKSTQLKYDALNKVQRIDALGQATTYLYDVRNRLGNVVYNSSAAANSQRNYAYDPVGNLLSVTEPNQTAANVVYTYDTLNRVISETSDGVSNTYHYDATGNRITTSYVNTGLSILSTYDALNRLNAMTENGRTTTYGYDLSGNIAKKTLPNGDQEVDGYDGLNRAGSQTTTTSGNAALCAFTYGYDLVGNVTSVGESYPGGLNNRTVTNGYDSINRLSTEAVTGSAPHVTTTYAYDSANNRTSKAISGSATTTYTYNTLNQLTGYSDTTGRSVALTYDHNGNRTTRTVSGGSDNGTDTSSYDFENRLIGLVKGTTPGAGTCAYSYDYRTRRIVRDESQAGGVATALVFSGGTSVQEYAGATSGTPVVEYIRGSDYGGGVGGILYSLRGGTPSYTHENKRGDVVAKTDASGTLTYQSQYEAFGNQTQTVGTTLDRQKSNSKDTDPTGLVDEGFRYRDLETGMFITRDPAGFVDGPNLYTYVVQNPWTKFDPEGLFIGGMDQAEAIQVATDEGKTPAEVHQAGQQAYQASIDVGPLVLNAGVASLPGVQEFQSTLTLQDPNASTLDKTLAAVSLIPIPELGALKSAVKDAEVAGKDAKAVAQETGTAANSGTKVTKPDAKPIDSTRPQHGTPDHDATGFNDALDKQNTPGSSDARYNQQLTDTKGNAIPGFRPDSQVTRTLPDGSQVKDVTEVISPSQNAAQMKAKAEAMKDALGSEAGDVKVIDVTKGASRNTPPTTSP